MTAVYIKYKDDFMALKGYTKGKTKQNKQKKQLLV